MMGMELYSPTNSDEEGKLPEIVRNYSTSGNNDEIMIGITRVGTKHFWYSISSGERIVIKTPQGSYASGDKYCMILSEKRFYYAFDCQSSASQFMCEKATVLHGKS